MKGRRGRLRDCFLALIAGISVIVATPPLFAESDAQIHADAYLAALRTVPGALSGLNSFTGQHIPASGALTADQNVYLIDLLYDSNGNPTIAYHQPTVAAQNDSAVGNYLQALRTTSGALASLGSLTGQTLPPSGALSGGQIQFLFSQLFDQNGGQTTAYAQPYSAAHAVSAAGAYLQALRQTTGALAALTTLTGQSLPASGTLSSTQIAFLFTQLFDAAGNTTTAYSNPAQAAQGISSAGAYLRSLRQTSGALAALQSLTGFSLPATGALSGPQIQFLFTQLYDASGHTTAAYSNPGAAAQSLVSAGNYLHALRATPGALAAL